MPSLQIVRSKLQRPQKSGDFVARSELLALLEAGSSRPLTLLVAPAGYGKTALVAHWLAGRDGLAAWLSLDRDDSDPIVFIRYFAAALRTALPDACAETLAHLDAEPPAPLAVLAGSLSNDLTALPMPLVLVLDDYHRIDSPQIHVLLDRLLTHPASALHLLVIARHDPPLSLGALRVREEVNEIRMRDLQLGERETAILLERCTGRAVSAAVLDRLQACCEGWPVGIRLAALALRQQRDAIDVLEHHFSGSTREVEQYFCEEVLAEQSVLTRDGLLRTSILERFCAPLCYAVLGEGGDGHSFMQWVSSGALLCVAIDDRLKWYRHQRLFREFLQQQLVLQYQASEISELHRRAAAWFETQGLLEEAIPQALAAAGAAAAGQLLARHAQLLLQQEQRQRLERCLRLLPPDTIEENPELLLLKAWMMYYQGRHVETPAVLDRIEVLLESAADGLPAAAALRGNVLALRSLQRYLEGGADLAIRTAEQAQQCLPMDCAQARVLAQAVIAGSRQMQGDLAGARQSLHAALARASGPINVSQASLLATLCFIDWMAADLSALQWTANQHYPLGEDRLVGAGSPVLWRYFHGLVQYQRNELALAETILLPALAQQPAPRSGYRTEVSFVLAAVYQALGQTDLAREIVDTVCEHLQRSGDSPALFRAQACQANLALRQGRTDAAREWARNFDPGPVQFVYRFCNAPHLTLARVWIVEGSAESREQADRLLQLLETELMARHNVRFLIEVLALKALLRHLQGEETAACELLGRAVVLAQPGGFIRLFVDLGQELVPPLKRLQAGQGIVGNTAVRYVGQILAAFNDDWLVNAGRQQVGADLTRRELKILKLLAVRLSNIEISEELCISRATVKRHTQNIYRKLRASSRREAVFKARTLNLLADA
ncbi:LuxR C-terminal-related transcriptional regulator [Candidatus Accumulibacter vicinus]|uniref:ATP-dependent transcriptional activator MalT n=1 Tax=Candidatus Accumulibacter vicinus TaxID=2954382 RepID=A0A084XVS4_9PROT|nr:LuxR C-terminal-related transcriptional regulator [Candidatus Accumulibacter vicinus]KFB66568.1 MAG: ATP-dependent transcriptional activator MalT [Candidatus Accumulibacter vicinus]